MSSLGWGMKSASGIAGSHGQFAAFSGTATLISIVAAHLHSHSVVLPFPDIHGKQSFLRPKQKT